MTRPLLVVDGDSFAHRSYHALPKTIRRRGGRGAGAIVGFANFLLRLYAEERPRAVLVGWDTLDAPTYRHQALPGYQGGRDFDADLIEQLDSCRNSSPLAALPPPRRRVTRPTIFWLLRFAWQNEAAEAQWWPAATVTRSSSPRIRR